MPEEKILIIDDDEEIRNIIAIYMKNEGYVPITAKDALEAFELLSSHKIDLIILDIMMPRMDGISACLKFREDNNMPIIIISAKDSDADIIYGLASGADDYLTKPFNPLELVARVKSQLRRYKNLNPRFDEADITDYAEKAYQKSLRIKGLLQELMDFASLAGEDIKLNKQRVSLKHLLEQLISEYTGIFQQNRLRIISKLTDEDVYANIDLDYMIRVFDNFFSNALRYSPKPGEISIALQRSDGILVFSITNQCPEIGQTELERLFDKFYRVEQSRSEETGGTGLGLAIAKRITELHGGRIWSEYARGEITFSVALADATDRKG